MQAVRAAGYRTSLFGKTHLYIEGDQVGAGDLRRCEWLLNAYGLDDVDEIDGPYGVVKSHMTMRWKELGLLKAFRKDMADRYRYRQLVRPSALGLEEYYDTYVGRRACEYLQAYDRPEPWCCWVSFIGPHEPWDTPEPFASLQE